MLFVTILRFAPYAINGTRAVWGLPRKYRAVVGPTLNADPADASTPRRSYAPLAIRMPHFGQ